jgi:RHS repeat-associated protein
MPKASFYIYGLLCLVAGKVKAQFEPAPYPANAAVNSVRVLKAKSPEKYFNKFLGKAQTDAIQITQFFDGLGRPLQNVVKNGSPLGNDIVYANCYDEQGRVQYKFLPFISSQTPGGNEVTNNGEFKFNPFQQQKVFYQNQLAGQNETYFYGQTEYESSPMNRAVKSMAPGESWVKNGVGTEIQHIFNQASEKVHIWNIVQGVPATSVTDVYADAKLSKAESKDEHQMRVITYTDLSGNVVLKKVQEKDGANVTNEHAGWSCTYYVYDDFNQLRFVIPAKAVAWLDNNNWAMTATIVNELCFKYEYDERRRMVVKKQPGAGETNLVYDEKDRVVFSQEANMDKLKNPALTVSQWLFTLYDEYDRVIATGLVNNNRDRLTMQNHVNNLLVTDVVTVNAFTGGSTSQSLVVNCPVAGYPANDSYLLNTNIVFNSVTHYDNYNYNGVKAFNTNFSFAPNSTDYVEPTEKVARLFGFMTGEKIRVIDNDNINSNDKYIFTTVYYDEKGRLIQILTDNIKGGVDYKTNQYDFAGKLLSSHSSHSNGAATLPVIAKNYYDKDGRLTKIDRNYNNSFDKTLAVYSYNELGQLKTKRLAPGYTGAGKQEMELQTFSYNILGALTGINKDFALSTDNYSQWDSYFGMYLGYDNRDNNFSAARLNGSITGVIWRSQGDNAVRKYDYTYDNLSRLTSASFLQKKTPSLTWSNSDMDFSAYASYEDANGNLKSLRQIGVMPGTAGIKVMDDLKYYYRDVQGVSGLTGNQLKRVDDDQHTMANQNGVLGDFKDGANNASVDDYEYDASGNLVRDLNKNIQQGDIVYNYLNKPSKITLTNKSVVEYIYDAAGSKISKKITKAGVSKTTYYIGGYVYEDNDLQYIIHEEGRIKVITPVNSSSINTTLEINGGTNVLNLPNGKEGVFEYFVKDYLGSTRMVLTEEVHKEFYRAYMETGYANTEEQLFGKVILGSNNTVTIPADNELQRARTNNSQLSTPWPNNSTDFVNLSAATGKVVGPNMILKVMAGDMINATARYFYKQNNPTSGTSTPVDAAVTSLIFALTGSGVPSIGKVVSPDVANNLQASGGDFATFINNTQPNIGSPTAPKAYLNIVFLDEQFKFIPGEGISGVGSNVQRVNTANADASFNPMVQKAPKNGWVYIYLSNESNEPVYFDDFFVSQEHGRISEESHYYPHGLKIAGISTRAFNKLPNKNGYQGDNSEEEDESGYLEFDLRMYDPQLGRWGQPDPYDEFASPYIGMGNDPVNFVDPSGGFLEYPFNWSDGQFWGTLIGSMAGAYVGNAIAKNNGWNTNLGTFLGAIAGGGAGYGLGSVNWGQLGNLLVEFNEESAGFLKIAGKLEGSIAIDILGEKMEGDIDGIFDFWTSNNELDAQVATKSGFWIRFTINMDTKKVNVKDMGEATPPVNLVIDEDFKSKGVNPLGIVTKIIDKEIKNNDTKINKETGKENDPTHFATAVWETAKQNHDVKVEYVKYDNRVGFTTVKGANKKYKLTHMVRVTINKGENPFYSNTFGSSGISIKLNINSIKANVYVGKYLPPSVK